MKSIGRNSVILGLGLAGVFAAAGVGFAAIPGSDGTVAACYATSDGVLGSHSKGDLRAVDSGESCRSYEKAIQWNQRGPAGPTGAAGKDGAPGPASAPAFHISLENSDVIKDVNNRQPLVTLDLPAGHWWLSAPMDVYGSGGYIECSIHRTPGTNARDDAGGADYMAQNIAETGRATFSLSKAITATGPITASVSCAASSALVHGYIQALAIQ